MNIDIAIIIQGLAVSIISASFIVYINLTIKHRKHEEKSLKLIHIKLESICSGMESINSQFETIGRDFKKGYDKKKEELMKENLFVE